MSPPRSLQDVPHDKAASGCKSEIFSRLPDILIEKDCILSEKSYPRTILCSESAKSESARSDQVKDEKAVGSCEGGSKKITYSRGGAKKAEKGEQEK
jgi:hypothetical protein